MQRALKAAALEACCNDVGFVPARLQLLGRYVAAEIDAGVSARLPGRAGTFGDLAQAGGEPIGAQRRVPAVAILAEQPGEVIALLDLPVLLQEQGDQFGVR